MDCFAPRKFVSLVSAALAVALVSVFALDRPVQAATYWSDSAPTSVSNLMPEDYWTNGAPTSADNRGYIIGKTLTVLFETATGDTQSGYTKNYTRVSVQNKEPLTGRILNVLITEAFDNHCVGKLV